MQTQEDYQRELYYNGYKLAVRDYDLLGGECCLEVIDCFDKGQIEGITFEHGYIDGYNYMEERKC